MQNPTNQSPRLILLWHILYAESLGQAQRNYKCLSLEDREKNQIFFV
jgi:hypothetical protein